MIREYAGESIITFTDVAKPTFIQRFLQPGYRHVDCYTQVAEDKWLHTFTTKCGIFLELQSNDQVWAAVNKSTAAYHVQRTERMSRMKAAPWFGLWNCIEVARRLVGCTGWAPISPAMLADQLSKAENVTCLVSVEQ